MDIIVAFVEYQLFALKSDKKFKKNFLLLYGGVELTMHVIQLFKQCGHSMIMCYRTLKVEIMI